MSYLPYGRQTVTEEDIRFVSDVMRGEYLTQGPYVPLFEDALCKRLDVDHVVAVNSATSALHIACLAVGAGKGDEIWTSPITFVASANCALYCGATVSFVDVDPSTGLMSVDSLRRRLLQARVDGKLPKAVIPVHLGGSSCDMEKIWKLSREFGFRTIEDASHAIGATYNNSKVGSCKYSDACIFSFHPVKIITTGEGGAVSTNDIRMAQTMRDLRSHGIVKDEHRLEKFDAGPWAYEQQLLGFNYRLTDIQAALGLSQISRLDEILDTRRSLLENYGRLLEGLPLKVLQLDKKDESSVHLAIVLLTGSAKKLHRDIFEEMRNNDIGVQLHYTPVHLQPYYRRLGFSDGDYKSSELFAKSVFSLPLYPGLSYDDQSRVCTILKGALKRWS